MDRMSSLYAPSADDAGDVSSSIAVHAARAEVGASKEDHGGAGSEHIKSIVFGGLDGIITTFAIVASVAGSSLPIQVVILSGFAKLLGDGLAMGLGDCMSEQAEHNHIRGEHAREVWEMDNYPQGEIDEMVAIYVSKGFSQDEAVKIIGLMTKKPEYRKYFIEHMMVQELGQRLPDPDDSPAKAGGVTFASFLFFGSLPLWPYVIFLGANYNNYNGMFGICIGVTVLCMFFLG